MDPFELEGTEEPDTSLDEEGFETLDDFNVFDDCDEFDDKDIY